MKIKNCEMTLADVEIENILYNIQKQLGRTNDIDQMLPMVKKDFILQL